MSAVHPELQPMVRLSFPPPLPLSACTTTTIPRGSFTTPFLGTLGSAMYPKKGLGYDSKGSLIQEANLVCRLSTGPTGGPKKGSMSDEMPREPNTPKQYLWFLQGIYRFRV